MASNIDIQSILDYFGSGSSIYQKIQLGTATDSEISYALSQIPRMQVDVSAGGTVLGYSYADPVYLVPSETETIIDSVTSNSQTASYGNVYANYPVSLGHDATTGDAVVNSGTNSLGGALTAVVDRVALGVMGVNLGAKLGKAIDQTLYNLDPDWWDTHYPTINPDTWTTIAGENEAGQSFIRTLFGIDSNGNTTAYVDENVLVQTYQLLRDLGLWQTGTTVTPAPNIDSELHLNWTNYNKNFSLYDKIMWYNGNHAYTYEIFISSGSGYVTFFNGTAAAFSNEPFIATSITTELGSGRQWIDYPVSNSTYYDGITYYYLWTGQGYGGDPGRLILGSDNSAPGGAAMIWDICHIIYTGTVTGGGIDGFTDISGATQYPPNAITGQTFDDVKQQLKNTYPDLFTDSVTENVVQPDGTTQTKTYVPVPWQVNDPTNVTQTSPVTQNNPTTSTTIDPSVAPDIVTHTEPNTLDDTTNTTDTPTTPDTGTGTTNETALPTGSASSLWAIYNPSQAQLDSFGSWLWSSDFVEQLKKLFNDPMQAIIGVHKVFATPHTGSNQNIKCGYLDSGVSSKTVTSQYTDVNCGSVNVREYFGNVFDYSPFTEVKIFLPFIGIVPLDIKYVMRSTITVKYRVDVLTGACIANVEVIRDGGGGVLFTYGGSAIVSYPISSGSYTGIITGALSILAGVAGTLISGGNPVPAALGVGASIGKMSTTVQHSGQFSGAAGAMGGKKPYLIISRPQTRVAENVNQYLGKPSNHTVKLNNCSGFTRVTDAHLIIPNAFDNEITEINNLLMGGVII